MLDLKELFFLYFKTMLLDKSCRYPWCSSFPKVILNGKLGDIREHPSYEPAKAGDLDAALSLVQDVINKETVEKIKKLITDKKPLLIPVHAEEKISVNRIPLAYALTLADILSLPVELNIVQAAKVNRTGADGFTRLAFPPPFAGKPSQTAEYAIILDDTLTQGGTLANLRGYIKQFNIETIAVTTLTGKEYSSILAITNETLIALRSKYNELETTWKEPLFGYGFDCLTESEARYILKSNQNANAIRDRIIAERQTRIFL